MHGRWRCRRVLHVGQRIDARCQRVDGVEQYAVALAQQALVGLRHGRNAAERCNERVVALNLALHPRDDFIVGQCLAVLAVQLSVQVHGLLAGVCHVEGVVRRLRVEHQPDLLALIHIGDQLLVLLSPLLFVHLHEHLLSAVVVGKFRAQYAQRACQVALLQYGPSLCQTHDADEQKCQKLLHIFVCLSVSQGKYTKKTIHCQRFLRASHAGIVLRLFI